jgi:hypothetical protein
MSDIYEFEIYFFGLICIHGNDESRDADHRKKLRAMLIEDPYVSADDPGHKALLFLNSQSAEYELDAASDVSFGNVSGGEAAVLPSFEKLVPHLKDLTRDATYLYRSPRNVNVVLPAGRIAAVDHYQKKGEYELDGYKVNRGTDCIARVTMLLVKTTQPEVTVQFKTSGTKMEARVPSDGWVLIANTEPPETLNKALTGRSLRSGFDKYAKATDHNADYLADLYELSDDCDESINNPPDIQARHLKDVTAVIKAYPPVYAHPECSNTNWP